MTYSQTFLARDLFVAYWGACSSAILLHARDVGFARARSDMFELRGSEHAALLRHVAETTGLPLELLQAIAGEARDWRPDDAWDAVSLLLGRRPTPGDLDGELVRALDHAALLFVEAFLAARFAFARQRPEPARELHDALTRLARAITPSHEDGARIAGAYETWARERRGAVGAHPDSDPAYAAWLDRIER